MNELEEKLEYHFKNQGYLKTALTHSSYANETKAAGGSNERLEFLGDSILGVVVADYLFKNFPDLPEGDLTKKRAALVCEKACCGFSRQLDLGRHLLLSHGEQNSGGRTRSSILADAFESVIAAIYMDGGMEEARKQDEVCQTPLAGARRPGDCRQPGENGCRADMRFAPPGGEAREGAKMPFGLDQLVAERAAQSDVAGCIVAQHGSLPPQGCAISDRRPMSTLA